MAKITVDLKPFTISSSKGEGYSHAIDPAKWTPEYLAYLAEYAAGVIVQRSTAALTEKAGGTEEQRTKAREAAIQKILDGTVGRVAGGMSREDAALRDALEVQKGFKLLRLETGETTEKGNAKTTAEPVAAAFARFVKMLCEKTGQPVNKDTTAQVLAKLKETSAYKAAMGEIDEDIASYFTKKPADEKADEETE